MRLVTRNRCTPEFKALGGAFVNSLVRSTTAPVTILSSRDIPPLHGLASERSGFTRSPFLPLPIPFGTGYIHEFLPA
jgi:hypothetical protein